MSNVRSKSKAKRVPLPESFESLEEAAKFWDTHDSGEYEEFMKEIQCEFDLEKRTYLISVEGALYEKVEEIAKQRGLKAGALVNRWLSEKTT